MAGTGSIGRDAQTDSSKDGSGRITKEDSAIPIEFDVPLEPEGEESDFNPPGYPKPPTVG